MGQKAAGLPMIIWLCYFEVAKHVYIPRIDQILLFLKKESDTR